eukprot:COSAG02_NODE_1148_length_14222_cov_8.954825_8_plen_51_part_00
MLIQGVVLVACIVLSDMWRAFLIGHPVRKVSLNGDGDGDAYLQDRSASHG